jgi:NTP pyrophosphatase (non-canonical NTP hydrolase)
MSDLKELTRKVKKIVEMYKGEYPDVKMDRDYFPHKLTEEWGECMKEYLMLTDRGRQKGFTKEQIKQNFSDEIADVFGYLLAFADSEGIDLEEALEKKWFVHLKK